MLKNHVYIYINKDGNPSTKSTRHVEANLNTQGKLKHENNSNEVEDLMLKMHPLLQSQLVSMHELVCVKKMKNHDERLGWLAHVGGLSTLIVYTKI